MPTKKMYQNSTKVAAEINFISILEVNQNALIGLIFSFIHKFSCMIGLDINFCNNYFTIHI